MYQLEEVTSILSDLIVSILKVDKFEPFLLPYLEKSYMMRYRLGNHPTLNEMDSRKFAWLILSRLILCSSYGERIRWNNRFHLSITYDNNQDIFIIKICLLTLHKKDND